MSRPLIVSLFCLLTAGCFYPAERGRMMESRLERLEEQNAEQARELAQQRARLEKELKAQVAEMQATLERLDKIARRSGADMGVQLEQVQGDLNALRGQVEQYQHRLSEIDVVLAQLKEQAAKPAAATATVPATAAPGAPGAPGAAGAAGAEPPAAKKELERPTDKKEFAELVVAKLEEDKGLGRKLADEWLKKHSKDALAPRVYYALGMSYFTEKNWRAALAEFSEIYKNFTKSEQAPTTLLRSAECFAGLKMDQQATLALEELVATYPKSEAAKEAKARLAQPKKPSKKK